MKTVVPLSSPNDEPLEAQPAGQSRMPFVFASVVLIALLTMYYANQLFTERFTETTRNRAELRMALYSGNVITELKRNSVIPLLLSQDSALISALNTADYANSSQRLIYFRDEIGADDFLLLDMDGRVVASTDRALLGGSHRNAPYKTEALRSNDTVFSVSADDGGGYLFAYSRVIRFDNRPIGVIVAVVDLGRFERSWKGISNAVMITNSTGEVILATEPRWRGKTVEDALTVQSPGGAIVRALRATADWTFPPPDAYIAGEAVLRSDGRIPFQGWRITSFTAYASVREKVWGILGLIVLAFVALLVVAQWVSNRRANEQRTKALQESADLRQLNDRLQREIAERKKAEKNLEVAEQSLEQSSKLAALGEMSAAVSHELNQPLAAMKTYLAGAKLLLQRRRWQEAQSSFLRLDDMIGRMGAITKQLKSYAAKGTNSVEPFDLRESVANTLSMMEPQLKRRSVAITRTMPNNPVLVRADRLKLEQVFVNLYRNAIEATAGVKEPTLELILTAGETAILMVRDNGHGIADLDSLFEPFYTTKAPGEGVGLGLAISSSIVNEMGGRLTARNANAGGAVFEVRLPISTQEEVAAE